MKTLNVTCVAALIVLTGCAEVRTTQELRTEHAARVKYFEDPDVSTRMAQRAAARHPELMAAYDEAMTAGRTFIPPKLVKAVSPKYPLLKRAQSVQGGVWIAFRLGADGTVTEVEALPDENAIGEPAFVAAAIAAVKRWEFEPARIDGKPVPFMLCVPVIFSLDE